MLFALVALFLSHVAMVDILPYQGSTLSLLVIAAIIVIVLVILLFGGIPVPS